MSWLSVVLRAVTSRRSATLAITILRPVVQAVTPELRDWLARAVAEFDRRAAVTPNEADNVLADILTALIGLPGKRD